MLTPQWPIDTDETFLCLDICMVHIEHGVSGNY